MGYKKPLKNTFGKHTEGVSIQDHYIAGAKWMLAQCEEWLRKSGRGQMIGSLNRYLEK